jgi:K+/H+ antiporter YhaU regulatory subunit KhtT
LNGLTIAEAERRGKGHFLVIQINQRDGETIVRPGPDVKIGPGDGLMVVAKGDAGSLAALFNAPKEAVRAGRMFMKP